MTISGGTPHHSVGLILAAPKGGNLQAGRSYDGDDPSLVGSYGWFAKDETGCQGPRFTVLDWASPAMH